ncbi:MAG: phenylalanine--tRNA ligase subunit alpha [Thermoprotei archaeon]|nr:phenylalanine--tRNA ligase subunit alpha [TACK group archaeon]
MSEDLKQRLLESAPKGEIDLGQWAAQLGVSEATLSSLLERMRLDGILEYSKREEEVYELTERGKSYQKDGLPEGRLYALLLSSPGLEVRSALQQLGEEGSAALSWAVRKKLVRLEKDDGRRLLFPLEAKHLDTVESLLAANPAEALARGIAVKKARKLYTIRIKGQRESNPKREMTVLTHIDIINGSWKETIPKPYDVTIFPPPSRGGRKNFFQEFLDEVREILESMGFEEMMGPYIESEFWNFDALFQPQNHPARELHDVLSIKGHTRLPSPQIVERVAAAHEEYWGYRWDPSKAASLILRSQNTAVSARYLAERGSREDRLKMYCVDRVFRKDEIDPRHHVEFYQSEGIVMDEGLGVRDLLGFLSAFADKLGFKEIKFFPSYFPFTEPSVEGYVRHPKLGWMETLPGGVLRPQVTRPLGVSKPVIAWGIGISRLAMAKFEIDDIRLLYSPDLGVLETRVL